MDYFEVINPNITKDIIKELCILPIEYKGNMDFFDQKNLKIYCLNTNTIIIT